ncbi:MAG TPA: DUF1801 domain-containing protein [Polyangiaceae bacterium]|nr:DUF1801 domain-containing protein [Polyangiaceae bacterium]
MRTGKPSPTEILHDVTAYFHALPKDVRSALKTLRTRVHAAVPAGTQGFSYRIPCLRLGDRPVVWYAGFKSHVSLYPMTAPVVKAHAVALRGLHMSTGTIRFPLDALPSAALVKKLVNSRLETMHAELPKRARKTRPKTKRTPRPRKKSK